MDASTPVRPDRHELELMLEHAEYLLSHAIEAGIELDADIAQRIIAARGLGPAVWDSADAGALIAAITKLAAKLQPVTAETLRACREDAHQALSRYRWIVMGLAAVIVPVSIISFIYTAISNSITADLTTANNLVVSLHAQLFSSTPASGNQVAPAGALPDLQQFAATMRSVYSRSKQLSHIVPSTSWDPYGGKYKMMQLPVNLENNTLAFQDELVRKTGVYQDVRVYAASMLEAASVVWGAISASILPVFYALLGACAYVLRTFTQQIEKRTYAPSYGTTARFVVAAIGGGVVGLFSNFNFGQGTSLSPLAVAFLIGYASDVFFSLLEGPIQNFRQEKNTTKP